MQKILQTTLICFWSLLSCASELDDGSVVGNAGGMSRSITKLTNWSGVMHEIIDQRFLTNLLTLPSDYIELICHGYTSFEEKIWGFAAESWL